MPQSKVDKISYAEFLVTPREDNHVEWVDGNVVPMEPVSQRHQELSGFLLSLLQHYVEEKRLGRVFHAPFQMKTGPDLAGRSPDIMFVANENAARLKKTHLDGPADLVVEVVSPENRERDRREKRTEYERGGVRECWFIDEEHGSSIFVVLQESGGYWPSFAGKDGIFHSTVLPGLWLRTKWFWHSPTPSIVDVLREWKLI